MPHSLQEFVFDTNTSRNFSFLMLQHIFAFGISCRIFSSFTMQDFFTRSWLAGIFFFQKAHRPPPSKIKWLAPYHLFSTSLATVYVKNHTTHVSSLWKQAE